ncbi:hypothetical protein [Pelagicoccus sp. SDUM812005]|uniref:hypothetical protein n=1 Tax=Pelagicoccus sp. SDUM812005 TaxID=3041257 RepID=UPI00280F92E6|nr:hypothetical protein [Pelagicoccus sp. SDUM812005]MDQ8183363.1 hypothetical protein [Pelagicoccus sp. SDUM812005]
MNTHYTRHIIVASLIAFVAGLGILNLYTGSEMLTASTAVIVALGFLGALELRRGTGSRLKPRQVKKRSHA